MCWGIYLAADRPLPRIEKGDAHFRQLAVFEVEDDRAQRVRRVTQRPHIHYVSSWQGCGCGFAYGTEQEYEEKLALFRDELSVADVIRTDRASALASVDSFSRYLAQIVEDGPVAVYAVDESDVGRLPSIRKTVGPSFFGGAEFRFGEESAMFEPTSLFEIEVAPI